MQVWASAASAVKLKIANGTVGFGIGYLAAEGDAANPLPTTICRKVCSVATPASVCRQLAWKSKDKKWLFTANYAYERGNNSMGKVGTELAKNPFGYSTLIESNQYGFTLAYKWSKQFQITGAYGGASMNSRYDSSVLGIDMVNAGDSAQTSSWMVGLNFKDVFIQATRLASPSVVCQRSTATTVAGVPTAVCRSLWKPGISSRSPTTSASPWCVLGLWPERREDRPLRSGHPRRLQRRRLGRHRQDRVQVLISVLDAYSSHTTSPQITSLSARARLF